MSENIVAAYRDVDTKKLVFMDGKGRPTVDIKQALRFKTDEQAKAVLGPRRHLWSLWVALE